MDIRFKYDEITNAVTQIKSIEEEYKTAASTLQTSFESAVEAWEGASKDAMLNLMQGPVNRYAAETVPGILEALASLLEQNAQQMQEADNQIATNINNNTNSMK